MSALDPRLQVKLESLEERSRELSALLAEPDVTSDMDRYRTLARSYADLSRVTEKFTAYRKKAADLEGLRLHDLRHAHATLMLRAGVHPKVVSERLGHASVNITLDTYSHVLPGLQEAAAAAIDRALDEPAELEEAR